MLTLLGMVLAIGLVVDDAIVVLENIHRHIEEGMPPVQAAIQGSREIAFAVIAMTITLAAVFAPLAFMTGNTGRLFTEFALTVAAAVLVSGFRRAHAHADDVLEDAQASDDSTARSTTRPERFFVGLNAGYRRALTASLRHRWVVDGGVRRRGRLLPCSCSSPSSPSCRRSRTAAFSSVSSRPRAPRWTTRDGYARRVEAMYKDVPEVENYFVVVAPGLERPNPVNLAFSFVSLKPWDERTRKQQQITAELRGKMFATLPGVLAFPINPPSLGQSFRNPPVQFVVQANSYEELDRVVNRADRKGAHLSGSRQHRQRPASSTSRSCRSTIDRDKAADVGVEVETIGRTLETLLGGRQVTRFKREGKQYDVHRPAGRRRTRRQPTDLTSIYVRGRDGQLIQLSNLVQVQRNRGAERAQPLQPAARGDLHGQRHAGLHAWRRARVPGQGGEGGAAEDGAHRARRTVARVQGVRHRRCTSRSCLRSHSSTSCSRRSSKASSVRS